MTITTAKELLHPRRTVPLRALEAPARPAWLRCSPVELAAMAYTAAALGIACADVAATTTPGRVGLFALGAVTGAPLGFRMESLLRSASPILRWILVCGGFVLGVVAVGAVVRWVT